MSFDIDTIDWSKSHCGVMLCDVFDTKIMMPEVEPILRELHESGLLEGDWSEYLIDIKVHMLMPNMYPCIPNWHYDFMPRDENGERVPAQASDKKMYMWISGAPLTEYRKEGKVFTKPAKQWHTFTQSDLHRGTASEEHTWRCFIRVIPKEFVHSTTCNVGTRRRHSQTYINPENFTW